MIHIHIPFDPVPWTAPRIYGPRLVYDPREKDKRAIRQYIRHEYNGSPLQGYVGLEFTFNFKVPKSYSKTNHRLAIAGDIIPTKCDCTNLQKLYEDCLKKIVIEDDRKVFFVLSRKRYAEKGSVNIIIHDEHISNQGLLNP